MFLKTTLFLLATLGPESLQAMLERDDSDLISESRNSLPSLRPSVHGEFLALYNEWGSCLGEGTPPVQNSKKIHKTERRGRAPTPQVSLTQPPNLFLGKSYVPTVRTWKQPTKESQTLQKKFNPLFLNTDGDIRLTPRELLFERWVEEQHLRFNVEQVAIEQRDSDCLRTRSERDMLHLIALFGKNESVHLSFDSHDVEHVLSRREKILAYLGGLNGLIAGVGYTPVFEQASVGLGLVDFSKADLSSYGMMATNFLVFGLDNGIRDYAIVAQPTRNTFKQDSGSEFRLARYSLIAGHALIQPLLLWNVELIHQRDAGASGFSPYIAAAIFLSPFLALNSVLQDVEDAMYITSPDPSTTVKERIFVYGLPLVNSLTRGLAYYSLLDQTLRNAGWSEENSRQMTSVFGGLVLANGVSALLEMDGTKSFVQSMKGRDSSRSRKSFCSSVGEYSVGIMTFACGAYNSLPVIAIVHRLFKDQSLGLKMLAYVPLAIGAGIQKQNYLNRTFDKLRGLFHRQAPLFYEAGISNTEESMND